jgi:hypothetical protein
LGASDLATLDAMAAVPVAELDPAGAPESVVAEELIVISIIFL